MLLLLIALLAPNPGPTSSPSPAITQRPRVESIKLVGVSPTRRLGLRERLGIETDAPLDEAAVNQGRLWLLSTGLFERVEPRLERGSRRGLVQLIFECVERPTFGLDRVYLGHARPTRLWLGAEVSDLDPFGLGVGVGAGGVSSERQRAGVIRLSRPGLLWRGLGFQLELRGIDGEEPWIGPASQRIRGGWVEHIPLPYQRWGGEAKVGGGDGHLQWTGGLRAEWVDVSAPAGAEVRGQGEAWRPLDVTTGSRALLGLLGGVSYDTRDNPISPTRGVYLNLFNQLSVYEGAALRVEGSLSRYTHLSWGHVLGLSARGGLILGDAAFFDRFFIGDWHPYLPHRALGLNFARRRGPMLLDEELGAARYEELAGQAGFIYRIPIGDVEPYRTEIYFGASALTLTTPGAAGPVPLDAAVDFGLRIESELGVLSLGLSESLLLLDP